MSNYGAESFFRSTIRQSVDNLQTCPFTLKVSKVPALTTGLLTISGNTNNEELLEYNGVDGALFTVTVTKRGINPSSQALTTSGVDYDNPTYQKAHSQNDTLRGDINHLHIIQDYGNLQTQINNKLNTAGGTRTGLTPNSVITVGATGNEEFSSGGFIPTGGVVPFAGTAAPVGYLLCDGSAVNRTTYSVLFSVTSTTYGVGDGVTTFNVPNLKGKVPVGLDSTQSEFDVLGETGGAKTHTLVTGEIPSHSHGVLSITGGGIHNGSVQLDSGVAISGTYQQLSSNGHPIIQNVGGGGAHNNLQPYIVLNYIIKT